MFGLSTWELLIIVAVALIFVGPDQLPKVARTIGKGMRQVRGAMGKVDDEMRKAVREVSAELDDEGHPLEEAPYRRPSERTEAAPPLAASTDPAPPASKSETPAEATAKGDPATPVEVQSSRRGAGRTMDERPVEPLGAHARDWSEVGKAPIPGRVAQVPRPAEPAPDTVADTTPATPPPEGPAT